MLKIQMDINIASVVKHFSIEGGRAKVELSLGDDDEFVVVYGDIDSRPEISNVEVVPAAPMPSES